MTDDRFDDLMRDAADSYNRPPNEPPLEEIWAAIEQQRSTRQLAVEMWSTRSPEIMPQRKPLIHQSWLRMAAMLVLGLGLGRASVAFVSAPGSEAPVAAAPSESQTTTVPEQYQLVTDHYLGQTAALLLALPGELSNKPTDASYVTRADELLLQTRLLLDSPATSDPALRMLFEDLEVVLAQVVRLQSDRDPIRIDMLNQALEQRDVIPRLRNAVVDRIADD
jgi:hypothetical protein